MYVSFFLGLLVGCAFGALVTWVIAQDRRRKK